MLRSVNADVALAAAVVQPPYTQSVPELFALSAQRTVTGLASTPIGLATAAMALAQGQNPAAQAILKEIVDGPQWAADPAIYAFDDLLPEPLGGDDADNPRQPDADSAISQFRAAVLIAARDDVNEAIADSLGVGPATQPAGNEVSPAYAGARLAACLGVSALRAAQSAVTAPLGLAAVAQGLQNSLGGGGIKELYLALQAYIDGPNYVTDPIVFAVDDVLPQAAGGGDPETNPARILTPQSGKPKQSSPHLAEGHLRWDCDRQRGRQASRSRNRWPEQSLQEEGRPEEGGHHPGVDRVTERSKGRPRCDPWPAFSSAKGPN